MDGEQGVPLSAIYGLREEMPRLGVGIGGCSPCCEVPVGKIGKIGMDRRCSFVRFASAAGVIDGDLHGLMNLVTAW